MSPTTARTITPQDVANARALISNPTMFQPRQSAEWPALVGTAWRILVLDRATRHQPAALHHPQGAA